MYVCSSQLSKRFMSQGLNFVTPPHGRQKANSHLSCTHFTKYGKDADMMKVWQKLAVPFLKWGRHTVIHTRTVPSSRARGLVPTLIRYMKNKKR